MNFPRREELADLVGPTYVDGCQWRVYKDIEGDGSMNVLIVLADEWTIIKGADFRNVAERVLRQIDQ